MLSPLCATAFVSEGVRFSYFFSVSLGLACLNIVSLFLTFWGDPEHGPLKGRTYAIPLPSETASIELTTPEGRELQESQESARQGNDVVMSTGERNKAMLKSKIVWLVALFLFFYVG